MNMRGLSRFLVKLFQAHSAEGLRGEPFCISENLSIEKKLMHKGGIRILPKNFVDKKVRRRECHNFTSKKLLSHSTKKLFVGELFRVSDNFLYGKET